MRLPTAKLFGDEREWYADQNENVLGVVIFDKHDCDWSFVVLGRDEVARFSAIDQDVSLPTIDEARKALHEKIFQYSTAGERVFPQGLAHKRQKTVQIFQPIVSPEKLHPDFVVLWKSAGYSPARDIITEIAYTFEDPDGNYIQQFQSSGFDARLWELYLYAVLHENDFFVDRNYKAPDYVCMKYDQNIVIEATTINRTNQMEAEGASEVILQGSNLADYLAINFGSALFSKLQKRYWELDHVKDRPLVFAVSDFRKPKGVHYSASYLMEYLYGLHQKEERDSICFTQIKEHVFGKKTIPSGFFRQAHAENIAAILFSDSGTISKFNRMGKLAGFGDPSVVMARIGQRYPNAQSEAPEGFEVVIDPSHYHETWAEGTWIFHNPNAKFPLDRELFVDAAHVYLENGGLVIYLTDCFPIWSKTVILGQGIANNFVEYLK